MNNQQLLLKSWSFLLSLIITISGGVAALVAACMIKKAQSNGHILSMTDGKYIQLSLGIIGSITGSFGILFIYIKKNCYCSTCPGQWSIHEPSMADRLREEKRLVDISMGYLTPEPMLLRNTSYEAANPYARYPLARLPRANANDTINQEPKRRFCFEDGEEVWGWGLRCT